MKPHILIHQKRTEIRKKPLNLVDEDLHLFEKAFVCKIDESTALHLKNVDVLKNTLFSLRQFKFHTAYTHILHVKKTYLAKRLLSLFRPAKKIDKAIWITDEWSIEYFHWLTDALSRLYSVQLFAGDFTIILPQSYQDKPYIAGSLAAFNFKVEYFNPKKRLKINELLLPGHVAPTGNYNSAVINEIRSVFLKDKLNVPARKIYISRQKAAKRTVLNEEQVTALMTQYGYEIHYFEDYSFQEQVEIMSEAISLVGLHGAGLTNMLFMPKGAQVLEFRNQSDSHNNCFFSLASALDHEYYYICNTGNSADTHEVNLTVDLTKLKIILQQMQATE
jgi:capsular polysaccharide biosynthesis protein